MSRLCFSSTLRTAVYWHALQQSFHAGYNIDITEVNDPDFDLSIEGHISKRKALVKLVDPSISMDKQISVLVKWTLRTRKEDLVAFVLPGKNAAAQLEFQSVQLSLLARQVPIVTLTIPCVDQVVPTLLTYAMHQSNLFPSNKRDISSLKLLSHATTSTPLKGHEALAVQQLCGCIEGLEREIRKEDFYRRMVPSLEWATVNSMVEFWQDEWII